MQSVQQNGEVTSAAAGLRSHEGIWSGAVQLSAAWTFPHVHVVCVSDRNDIRLDAFASPIYDCLVFQFDGSTHFS